MRLVSWTALLLALSMCGCFRAIRALQEGRVCTPQAADRAGLSDARAGRPLDEQYAAICGVAESPLNERYRRAYEQVPSEERGQAGWLEKLLGSDPAQAQSGAEPELAPPE